MANIRYIEAPDTHRAEPGDPHNKAFIGGGIPGVDPTWHDRATGLFAAAGVDVVLLCPRRRNFPLGDVEAGREQVRWEHEHLHLPGVVSMFWYPESPVTVPQPSALWETAMAIGEGRPIVVGADPAYGRRDILENQLALYPDITLHDTLEATVAATVAELKRPSSKTLQVTWAPEAVREAIERARAIVTDEGNPPDYYRFGNGHLMWADLACLVDAATHALNNHSTEGNTTTNG